MTNDNWRKNVETVRAAGWNPPDPPDWEDSPDADDEPVRCRYCGDYFVDGDKSGVCPDCKEEGLR